MISPLRIGFIALLSIAGAFSALAQNYALVMDSDPGDFIGQGQNYYFTPAEGALTASRNFDNGVSVFFANGSHDWRLDFAAPNQAPLRVQLYDHATRLPFQEPGEPGLSVVGDGRGCNQLTGQFEVKEIKYGAGDKIRAFHVTFVQHCEGGGPALRGEVLFNSSDPLPPKNHITSDLAAFATQGQPFEYLVRASNNPTSFTASNLPAGLSLNMSSGLISGTPTVQGNFLIAISAVGSAGTASNTLDLTIDPPGRSTGPYTALYLTSDKGDFVGQGEISFFKESDGDFSASGSFNSVFISFSTPNFSHFWSLNFDAPTEASMGLGIYRGATRFASAANPGLDISGDGGGCNETLGSFEIKELAFQNTTLTSFHAAFEQHCENQTPALRGEVWFHSTNAITSNLQTRGARGQAFSYQIVANNQPTSYGASGLPPGLSINPSTGIISGTPTIGGTFRAPITAIGPNGTATSNLTLDIKSLSTPGNRAPVISSSSTATGTINQAFNYQITAWHHPTQFSATGLPPGLSINSTDGQISGTPTVTGTFNVIVKAKNSGGTGGGSLTLSIFPPIPVITSRNHVSGFQGKKFTFQVTASNQPDSFSANGLPDGLTIGATTGLISGELTAFEGKYNVQVRAGNGSGNTFQILELVVRPPRF